MAVAGRPKEVFLKKEEVEDVEVKEVEKEMVC